jgi:hypothetical protein
MEKIYFKRGKESQNLDDLLSLLFNSNGYSRETYYDEEFTSIQCYAGSRRSFEDLLCIANTYYPETTEEQLMQAIVNVDLAYYYCSDINKIVFHYAGSHKPSLHGFEIEKWANVSYKTNTYTLPMLQKIYNNLKIKTNNLTLGESC